MPEQTLVNRLASETSPYLLQHAANPVAWQPWSNAALDLARREDRPILLSIGYSACHWCHVMAHESFSDPATAALMNRLFVNVKVDREERPDLDRIYQAAHQFLNGRGGGWPLTVFLAPDSLSPYFAGTYFPQAPRYGLPAFRDILQGAADHYRTHGGEIAAGGRDLARALDGLDHPSAAAAPLDAAPLDIARHQLAQAHDRDHGGFGGAPKFPQPPLIERLLRHWARAARSGHADDDALAMADRTLDHMARGGVCDQLGGGFYRYAVDECWAIPHFEKMLYDNGQLLALYAEAWRATRRPLYARTAAQIAEWAVREMQAPAGGYYAALDADSEGGEGRFYLWRADEARALLDDEAQRAAAACYGLDRPANFSGLWHLALAGDVEPYPAALEAARRKLLAARERRARPHRDEKILTSWNALMMRGMAVAARTLGRRDLLASAHRALDFIRTHHRRAGRLLAASAGGSARIPGYLDDYAFLIDALLELLQSRWSGDDLRFAVGLADAMLEEFEDRARGGLYFSAAAHDTPLARPKPYGDDATPSGNGIAAKVLIRLGHLLDEPRYLAAAERILRAAWPSVMGLPYAHAALLGALEEFLDPPQLIILRGDPGPLAEWQARCQRDYAPARLCFAIPRAAAGLPAALARRECRGAITAYVCAGTSCSAPLAQLAELEGVL